MSSELLSKNKEATKSKFLWHKAQMIKFIMYTTGQIDTDTFLKFFYLLSFKSVSQFQREDIRYSSPSSSVGPYPIKISKSCSLKNFYLNTDLTLLAQPKRCRLLTAGPGIASGNFLLLLCKYLFHFTVTCSSFPEQK